jgi:hypothetical protein
MAELYDDQGNPIEALTPQEAEAQKAEAVEAAKAEIEESYRVQLEEKETELEKERAKEKNFAALRNHNQELSKKQEDEEYNVKSKIEELERKVEEAKNEGVSKVNATVRDEAINIYAGDDKELKEKIAKNYDLINKPGNTKDEITERARDAYLISIGLDDNDLLQSRVSSPSGPGRSVGDASRGESSEELKNLGSKFGISPDDWGKFGPK